MLKNLVRITLVIVALVAILIAGGWLRTNYEKYLVKIHGKSTIVVNLDRDFILVEDQTALIESENLRIKLVDAIYQPCPKQVVCFWSGVGADIEFKKDNSITQRIVESGSTNNFFGYKINLVKHNKTKVTLKVSESNN